MQIARMRLGREEDAISLLCLGAADAQGHQDEEMEKSAFKYKKKKKKSPSKEKERITSCRPSNI